MLKGTELGTMINGYNDENNVFYRFVKYPVLLQYCEQKNIQKWGNSYCLVKQQRARENNFIELETFCLYYESTTNTLSKLISSSKDWEIRLWAGDSSALVFDKSWNGLKVAIDVHYNRVKLDDWDIQLFLRDKNSETELKDVADACKLVWNGTRYEIKDLSKKNVIDKINELMTRIH